MKILAARLNWSSRSSLSAHWWTDLVASSTRWRAVCSSREVGGVDIGLPRLVGLGRRRRRLPSGGRENSRGLFGAPKLADERRRYRQSDRRHFVPLSALCRA